MDLPTYACRCALWLCSLNACRFSQTEHGVRTTVGVRVPASVIAAHAAELPLVIQGRRNPGTLANRGFLLGTICTTGEDVTTDWILELAVDTEVTVWLDHAYPNDPNTPCGIAPEVYRRDRISSPPEGRPRASARIAPGRGASLLLAD